MIPYHFMQENGGTKTEKKSDGREEINETVGFIR